jgi:hypothetical protein
LARIALAIAAALALSAGVAGAASTVGLVRLSTDPYTNTSSQHKTEVEPDSFSRGSTIVTTFQVGRFNNGGASNVGWATSIDGGSTWANGFLPSTTVYASPAGPYARVSDPSVAYDAKHDTWMIVTLAIDSSANSIGPIVSRSLDGGLTWEKPITIDFTGSFPDKSWVACDNTATSAFYGNCYVEWDDAGAGERVEMNTSTDGGLTWSAKKTTADNASGLGGQPVVRPNGTVVVPYLGAGIRYFTSTNGGSSWTASQVVSSQTDHAVAGGLRTEPLPSAEIDKRGRVFVAWQDCRFRTSCGSNDIVYAIIKLSGAVSATKRVPIDGTGSGMDHFIPGIAIDPTTGGKNTHIALTYYYYPVAGCSSTTCQLDTGFISSTDTGTTWSAPTQLAGPMTLSWLPSTTLGRMVGDYISTSYVNGKAFPAMIVANAPSGSVFDEAAYSTVTGLVQLEPGTASAAGDEPVPGAASDHPPVVVPNLN